jgi:hypothetical protein
MFYTNSSKYIHCFQLTVNIEIYVLFQIAQITKQKKPVNRKRRHNWRRRYLREIKKIRQEGRPFLLQDTWLL